jgi:hypothetical protein
MDSQAASRDAIVHVAGRSLGAGTASLRSEETAAQLTFLTFHLRVASVSFISLMDNFITLWSEWETSLLTFQLVTQVGSLDIVTLMIDSPMWDQNVGTVPVLNTNMLFRIIPCSTLAVLFEWDRVLFHMELWVFLSAPITSFNLFCAQ